MSDSKRIDKNSIQSAIYAAMLEDARTARLMGNYSSALEWVLGVLALAPSHAEALAVITITAASLFEKACVGLVKFTLPKSTIVIDKLEAILKAEYSYGSAPKISAEDGRELLMLSRQLENQSRPEVRGHLKELAEGIFDHLQELMRLNQDLRE